MLKSNKPFTLGEDWTIVGYQTLIKFYDLFVNCINEIRCMFVDEAHNCKAVNNFGEPSSKRALCTINLAQMVEYCYPITGTPIPTSNKDLYNLLKMIGVDYNFFAYGKKYCAGFHNGFGWDFTGNSNKEELHTLLNKHMVRRRKQDVLPHLKKQRLFIPIETENKAYKKVEFMLMNSDDSTYMALAMTGRRLLSLDKAKQAIDLTQDLLEQNESVVVVTEFTETVELLKKKFKDNCVTIVGGMSDKAKEDSIESFQSGKAKVCVLNIVAGGVGITLTKAHNMIICDYDWTPGVMSQVEDCICRSGQTECYNIHYIYCENSIFDKLFVDMITNKSQNIDAVVDGAENTMDLVSTKTSQSNYFAMLTKYVRENKGVKQDTKDVDLSSQKEI